MLPLLQSERGGAQSGWRCRDARFGNGRRRGAAVTSALFGGLGKLFNGDISDRTRAKYQVPGCLVAPQSNTGFRSAIG